MKLKWKLSDKFDEADDVADVGNQSVEKRKMTDSKENVL
jgi:hypothetical protein